jgi:hypothetical protein
VSWDVKQNMATSRSTVVHFGLMVIMVIMGSSGCERFRNLVISFVVWKADNMETKRTFQIMCMVSHKLDTGPSVVLLCKVDIGVPKNWCLKLYVFWTVYGFRLPPRCKWDLRSFGILCYVEPQESSGLMLWAGLCWGHSLVGKCRGKFFFFNLGVL